MNAKIEKETDDGFGVTVYDNNNVEHKIGVLQSGEIHGHLQEGYPDDPADRTDAANQHVAQARRYAQWHVYQHTEYETLPPAENPERIAGVLLALQSLDESEFETLFRDFYRQIVADNNSSVTPPVTIPQEVRNSVAFLYQLDVSLEQTTAELREQTLEMLPDIAEQLSEMFDQDGITGDSLSAIFESVGMVATDGELDLPASTDIDTDFDIAATSGVDILYYPQPDSPGKQLRHEDLEEANTDVRLTIEPGPIADMETFRYLLIHHLACQIRDFYLGMGEQPPEAYRLVGRGLWEFTNRYNSSDFYKPYHEYDAKIEGYYRAF